jgi:monofunctional biosynthetic peptidoglycan transglycosylase
MSRRVLLAALAALAASAALFWLTLPDVAPLEKSWPKTTAFMERRKAELARRGESTRLEWTPVPLSRIAASLRRAAVVAEDARFWSHDGIDWDAVREAFDRNWREGELGHGASTITQQLAKNLYLSPARSPWRKLREWVIARRLERRLSKSRILELYLNVIEFGRRTYGAEAAARRYFGKSAAALSAPESATLAAIIPSPRIYDPARHPRRVALRARRILARMGGAPIDAAPGPGSPEPPATSRYRP